MPDAASDNVRGNPTGPASPTAQSAPAGSAADLDLAGMEAELERVTALYGAPTLADLHPSFVHPEVVRP